jgi:DNA repair exonuclease SbcCD nuclease subunit
MNSFLYALDECMRRKVDFIIITGDLFHSNIPDLAVVNVAVKKMSVLVSHNIPIYVIYGSHDYSPNETSIVDILSSANLFKKVVRGEVKDEKLKLEFFTDHKTGAKIVGVSARRLGLEKKYFEILDRESLESEPGFKIFAFHSGITELKPRHLTHMESIPLSYLPKGFNYYAGGHIHQHFKQEVKGYGLVAYAGTTFAGYPRDLEENAKGEKRGFFIISFNSSGIENIEFVEIPLPEHFLFEYDATGKSSTIVREELIKNVREIPVKGKIVLLKVSGEMAGGNPSDIDFTEIRNMLLQRGALYVSVNRHGLTTKEYGGFRTVDEDVSEVERKLLREDIGTVKVSGASLKGEEGAKLAFGLLNILRQRQKAGETKKDYENRMLKQAIDFLKLEGAFK